jgi:hypothetical protein
MARKKNTMTNVTWRFRWGRGLALGTLAVLLGGLTFTAEGIPFGGEAVPDADIAALRGRALETKDPQVVAECASALARIDGPEAGAAVADVLAARVITLEVFPATRVVAAACRITLERVTRTPAERRSLVQRRQLAIVTARAQRSQIHRRSVIPLWVALQEVKDTEGIHWRDKILAAGALAAHGDAEALEFLLRAYREPVLLLSAKEVQSYIRDALCAVPDVKATTFLATELQRMNDPYECLHCLGVMLRADNAQAIVLVRRVFPILKDEDDLLLAETLLRVLDRYGERRDLALLPAIVSERLLAGVGPDRSRLEEMVQRTRARLSAESAAPEAPSGPKPRE